MRLTTLAFVLTVLVVAQAEARPKAKPQTVKIHIGINTNDDDINTKSDNTGTIESGVGPQHPKDGYTLVEGWKDCMVQKDKGFWCLPAHRPKSNKCLEKSWKELQGPHMG